MECYCCLRRGVLPLNCNCERLTCRNCLKCARHCECGRKTTGPACARTSRKPGGSGQATSQRPAMEPEA